MSLSEETVRSRISSVSDRQDSIQGVSMWAIHHIRHAHLIASTWLTVLVNAPMPQKLSLIYLANDIVQTSRKKSEEYSLEFGKVLVEAFTHCFSACTPEQCKSMTRVINIWGERRIYAAEFLDTIRGAIGQRAPSATTAPASTGSVPAVASAPASILGVAASVSASGSKRAEKIAAPSVRELCEHLKDMEKASTEDAHLLREARSIDQACYDLAGVSKIRDKKKGQALLKDVGDAIRLLAKTNGRLIAQSEDYVTLIKAISNALAYHRAQLPLEKRVLEDCEEKLARATKVSKTLRRRWPDLPENNFQQKTETVDMEISDSDEPDAPAAEPSTPPSPPSPSKAPTTSGTPGAPPLPPGAGRGLPVHAPVSPMPPMPPMPPVPPYGGAGAPRMPQGGYGAAPPFPPHMPPQGPPRPYYPQQHPPGAFAPPPLAGGPRPRMNRPWELTK